MTSSRWALFLGIVALTTAAGCASGTHSVAIDPSSGRDGAGAASPPSAQIQDCRNRGVYNRAAGFCVGEGP